MENTLKILEAVDKFYSQSFNQLIIITVAVLGFAGILMPLMITWYQKRIFKLDRIAVEEKIRAEMKEILSREIEIFNKRNESIRKRYKEKITSLEDKIEKKLSKSLGAILHVQGASLLRKKSYTGAIASFVEAGKKYIKSDNESNLRRIINVMIETLTKLDRSSIDKFDNLSDNFEEFLNNLEEYNQNGRYTDDINSLKRNMKTAIANVKKDVD